MYVSRLSFQCLRCVATVDLSSDSHPSRLNAQLAYHHVFSTGLLIFQYKQLQLIQIFQHKQLKFVQIFQYKQFVSSLLWKEFINSEKIFSFRKYMFCCFRNICLNECKRIVFSTYCSAYNICVNFFIDFMKIRKLILLLIV